MAVNGGGGSIPVAESVYRISTAEEWEELQKKGSTSGGEIDKTTSCFHLSNLEQVYETLQNFFQGREDLYLLQIDSQKIFSLWNQLCDLQSLSKFNTSGGSELGDGLVYETVDGSNFFPHFYGPSRSFSPLPVDVVKKAEKLTLSNGTFSCDLLK